MNLQQKKKLTFKRLIQFVAEFYNIQIKNITGTRRKKDFVKARQIVAYLAREKLKKSFPAIARTLGGRDHTTAIYSYRRIKEKIEREEGFKEEIENILSENYVVGKKGNVVETKFPTQEIKVKKLKFIIKSPKDLPQQKLSPESIIRQGDILKNYKDGQTLEKIGKEYNLTKERIRQIVEKGLINSIGEMIKDGIVIDSREFLEEEKHRHLLAMKNKHGIIKKDFFSIQQQKQKRWTKYYDRCRKCGTNVVSHHSHGYCKKCYPKTEVFKELQESSRLRNIEKRRKYTKEYHKKYINRPEVVARIKKRMDLKFYEGNREKALLRDDYRCCACGITKEESLQRYKRDLCVDHKIGTNNDLDNLITRCKACHYSIWAGKRRKNNGGVLSQAIGG